MSTGELCFGFFFLLFSAGEHSVTVLRAECAAAAAQIAQCWRLKNISAYSKKKKKLENKSRLHLNKKVFSYCSAKAELFSLNQEYCFF